MLCYLDEYIYIYNNNYINLFLSKYLNKNIFMWGIFTEKFLKFT